MHQLSTTSYRHVYPNQTKQSYDLIPHRLFQTERARIHFCDLDNPVRKAVLIVLQKNTIKHVPTLLLLMSKAHAPLFPFEQGTDVFCILWLKDEFSISSKDGDTQGRTRCVPIDSVLLLQQDLQQKWWCVIEIRYQIVCFDIFTSTCNCNIPSISEFFFQCLVPRMYGTVCIVGWCSLPL